MAGKRIGKDLELGISSQGTVWPIATVRLCEALCASSRPVDSMLG